ncbi:MAG: hypothetical protein JSS02_12090 [Planctomycetes bacterium]|nr:hypothetical protein [Planctomycetota bacterium]
MTRGKAVNPDKVEDAVRSLTELPDPAPTISRVQLWSNPYVAGLMVTLMGIFWIGRKVVGLI